MFTGIIESIGVIKEVIPSGSNKIFWIESSLAEELKIDQSISHDGICLTVEEVRDNKHKVTAISETLKKTTFNSIQDGNYINLERSLRLDSMLDGHIVQGHVDTIGRCVSRQEKNGSFEFEFNFPKKFAELIIEKGSIAVNGISLTAFEVKKKSFKTAIIPYTFEHTNIKMINVGDSVNLEFDLLGKYILRRLSLK